MSDIPITDHLRLRLDDLRAAYEKMLSSFPMFERDGIEFVLFHKHHEAQRSGENYTQTTISCAPLQLLVDLLALRNLADKDHRYPSGVMQFNLPESETLLNFLETYENLLSPELFQLIKTQLENMDIAEVRFSGPNSEISLHLLTSFFTVPDDLEVIFHEIRRTIMLTRAVYTTAKGCYSSLYVTIPKKINEVPVTITLLHEAIDRCIGLPYTSEFVSSDSSYSRLYPEWDFKPSD